jgi:hypothetical protein
MTGSRLRIGVVQTGRLCSLSCLLLLRQMVSC